MGIFNNAYLYYGRLITSTEYKKLETNGYDRSYITKINGGNYLLHSPARCWEIPLDPKSISTRQVSSHKISEIFTKYPESKAKWDLDTGKEEIMQLLQHYIDVSKISLERFSPRMAVCITEWSSYDTEQDVIYNAII